VKWFEDAFENTVKEDVKEMLHPEQDVAADGSEQEAPTGKGENRGQIHQHAFITAANKPHTIEVLGSYIYHH
jgi:hypothetical protein